MRILIIEDDEETARFLANGLIARAPVRGRQKRTRRGRGGDPGPL
jgi:hypothetical protein